LAQSPVSRAFWHNLSVNRPLELKKIRRYAEDLRAEKLEHLRFEDGLRQCLALSALSLDLVVSFSSVDELIRIQNNFPPGHGRTSDAKKHTTRRRS
jgi:hypothetical protein